MTMVTKDGGKELKIKLVTKKKQTENSYLVRVRSGSPPERGGPLGNMKNAKSSEQIKEEFETSMHQHPGINKDVHEL